MHYYDSVDCNDIELKITFFSLFNLYRGLFQSLTEGNNSKMLTHWLQHSVFPDFKITAYWWGIGRGYWTVALTGLFFLKKKTMKINKNFLRVCACLCVVFYWLALEMGPYNWVALAALVGRGEQSALFSLLHPFPPMFHGEFLIGRLWGVTCPRSHRSRLCNIPQECFKYAPAQRPLEVRGTLPSSADSSWTQT